MRELSSRTSFILALLLVSMLSTGCSAKSSVNSVRVTGSVSVKGKPAAYANLLFQPISEDHQVSRFTTRVDERGEFDVLVRLPEGGDTVDYRVGVSWRIPKNPLDRNDPNYGKELLPKKFQDPKQSGVKATIDPSTTELPPFDLNP